MPFCAHVLLWFVVGAPVACAVDKTRQAQTFGNDVVFTVNEFLRANNLFSFDYGFLRRVAYVETLDGKHSKTYNTTSGGIWRVNRTWFQSTQSRTDDSLVQSKRKIQSVAGIDWSQVTYEDLDKPIYSALAAGLFFGLDTIPSNIVGQASFWNRYYHSGNEDNAFFEAQVAEFESTSYCAARALVYFVLDGSGSVGAGNFQTSLAFLNHIVAGLDVGDKKTRIAMLHYAHYPTKYFGFLGDKASIKDRISSCPYTRGGTGTGAAIDAALSDFQDVNVESGVGRVLVVLTDGRSGDSVDAAAQRAAAAGVTTVAVGIGNGVRESELLRIANNNQANVLQASNFNAIDNIIAMLQTTVCLVPAPVNLEEDTEICLRPDETTWLETPAAAPGICVTVRVISGDVAGYASFANKHPNSAIYETLLGINANTYVETNSSAQTLYLAFQTQSESACLILNLNPLCPTFTSTTSTTTHPFKAIKRFYADAACSVSTGYVEQTINNDTGCITELRYKDGVWDNNTYYSRYHCHKGKKYLVTYTKNTGCWYDPFTADGLQYIQYCLTNFLSTRCDVAKEVTDDWDKRRTAQCFEANDPRGLEGWGLNAKSEQYDSPLPAALACGESSSPDFFFTTTDKDRPVWTDAASGNVISLVSIAFFLLFNFMPSIFN